METLSALLAICAGKPPVTGEFQAQTDINYFCDISLFRYYERLLSFLWCQSEQAPEQAVEGLVIWDTVTLMGRRCNEHEVPDP